MSCQPKAARGCQRFDPSSRPPISFLADAMQFAVMCSAQRNRELITDLLSKSAILRELEVMRVARLTSAEQARLLRDEPQMMAIALP